MSTSILKKVLILFCVSYALTLFNACEDDLNCNCPPVVDFFDFGSMEFSTTSNQVSPQEEVRLFLEPQDLEFLAQAAPDRSCKRPWFINTAFACSCIPNGWEGLKFSIENLTITSDADFAEQAPAGTDLSTVFEVRDPQTNETVPLQSVQDKSTLFFPEEGVIFTLLTPPSADQIHTFTIEIEKNGAILQASTDAITWTE